MIETPKPIPNNSISQNRFSNNWLNWNICPIHVKTGRRKLNRRSTAHLKAIIVNTNMIRKEFSKQITLDATMFLWWFRLVYDFRICTAIFMLRVSFTPVPKCVEAYCSNRLRQTPPLPQQHKECGCSYRVKPLPSYLVAPICFLFFQNELSIHNGIFRLRLHLYVRICVKLCVVCEFVLVFVYGTICRHFSSAFQYRHRDQNYRAAEIWQ